MAQNICPGTRKALREQMNDAMILRGFAARTQESYLAAVRALAKYYRRSPDSLTAEEVEAYHPHLIVERKLAYSSVNQSASACRFLFDKVLRRQGGQRSLHDAFSLLAASPARLLARVSPAHLVVPQLVRHRAGMRHSAPLLHHAPAGPWPCLDHHALLPPGAPQADRHHFAAGVARLRPALAPRPAVWPARNYTDQHQPHNDQ